MLDVKVFLTDLAAYNRGELNGEWVSLPTTEDEISEIVEEFTSEEYFLTDWECKVSDGDSFDEYVNLRISEYEDIFKLNDFMDDVSTLKTNEVLAVIYLINYTGLTHEDALDSYQDVIVHRNMNLEDLANDTVDTWFKNSSIPDFIRGYIDHDKLVRTLKNSGELFYDDILHTTFECH